MTALSEALYRVLSRGWTALVGTLAFVVFSATVLPAQAEKAEGYAGAADGTPDSAFFYTASDLYAWAEAFGADGRSDYVYARYTFDLVWPLVYTFFLVAVLSWLLPKVFAPGSRWRLLNLLPVLAMLLDYAENLAASIVVSRWPSETPLVADVATLFTMGKWLSLTAAFILVAYAGVAAVVRRLRVGATPTAGTSVPSKEEAV